jgi:hypothetical protein
LAGLPVAAAAQTDASTSTPQQTATSASQQTTTSNPIMTQDPVSHGFASGFVGSNFARNADESSTEFGGSVGYLWKSKYGAEFDAGFTPDFVPQNKILGVNPQINTYMANAIGAVPLGADGQWLPFVSGGVGGITLRSGLSSADALEPDASRFGGNIGAGLMGFSGMWGFKADVRYYRASGAYSTGSSTTPSPGPSTPSTPSPSPSPSPSPTPPGPGPYIVPGSTSQVAGESANGSVTPLADTVLTGLAFWRANVGVALRW